MNPAFRLESLTKEYHGGLIISEAVKDKIPCRLLGIKINGRKQAENVYAPEEIT